MSGAINAPDRAILITGGNRGLGYECAREIAAALPRWHVLIASRDVDAGHAAAERLSAETGNPDVEHAALDLSSLASVHRVAGDLAGRTDLPPLRAVVCNAGIQIVSELTFTQDGFETTFAVNHLGHFLLVNLLLDHLTEPARIVFVSSDTHDPKRRTGMPAPRYTSARELSSPDRDDGGRGSLRDGRQRYTTSKLCNVLCAYELARRLNPDAGPARRITSNAFNPGLMPGSGLARDYGPIRRFAWDHLLPPLRFVLPNVNSTKASGRALARLVLDRELEGVSGSYFEGMKLSRSSAESHDEAEARELWEGSSVLTGLTES